MDGCVNGNGPVDPREAFDGLGRDIAWLAAAERQASRYRPPDGPMTMRRLMLVRKRREEARNGRQWLRGLADAADAYRDA